MSNKLHIQWQGFQRTFCLDEPSQGLERQERLRSRRRHIRKLHHLSHTTWMTHKTLVEASMSHLHTEYGHHNISAEDCFKCFVMNSGEEQTFLNHVTQNTISKHVPLTAPILKGGLGWGWGFADVPPPPHSCRYGRTHSAISTPMRGIKKQML